MWSRPWWYLPWGLEGRAKVHPGPITDSLMGRAEEPSRGVMGPQRGRKTAPCHPRNPKPPSLDLSTAGPALTTPQGYPRGSCLAWAGARAGSNSKVPLQKQAHTCGRVCFRDEPPTGVRGHCWGPEAPSVLALAPLLPPDPVSPVHEGHWRPGAQQLKVFADGTTWQPRSSLSAVGGRPAARAALPSLCVGRHLPPLEAGWARLRSLGSAQPFGGRVAVGAVPGPGPRWQEWAGHLLGWALLVCVPGSLTPQCALTVTSSLGPCYHLSLEVTAQGRSDELALS